jgi:hypothetical protein
MLALAATLALALPGVGAAGSPTQSAHQQPEPQKLWNQYPLDAKKASSPRSAGKTHTLPAGAKSTHGQSQAHGTSMTLWLLLSAALAALIGAVALVSGAARPRWPWAGVRLRAAARDFAGSVAERARLLASESERGLLAMAEHRPQFRLRAGSDDSARNGRRQGSVVAALLDALPRATEAHEPVDQRANAASGRPAPTPEHATLKRKGAVANGDPVEKLKKKNIAPPTENERQQELTLLKAKLAEETTPAAPARAVVGTGRDERTARQERGLAPPSPRGGARLNLVGPAPLTERCRIDWWRGYVKSEFHAKVERPDGSESVVMSSPPFRWSKPTPPPGDLPPVVAAHATLVRDLESAGWVATGHGDEWFTVELERRPSRTAREREE